VDEAVDNVRRIGRSFVVDMTMCAFNSISDDDGFVGSKTPFELAISRVIIFIILTCSINCKQVRRKQAELLESE
jgi:hypothetical protein